MGLFWEIAANLFNTVSILLAGRNSVHTWWTGIVGGALFLWVFASARLYADVTLQVFFIVTGVVGWLRWRQRRRGSDISAMATADPVGSPALPVRRTRPGVLLTLALLGVVVTLGYGRLLHRYTNAYAPFVDSVVLVFSVLAQFLLVGRRIENWGCWLLVNTLSVPLYASRGLYLTAALYAVYWVNAVVSLRHWQRLRAQGQ